MLEKRLEKHIDLLMKRYPTLEKCRQDIIDGYLMLEVINSWKWWICC